MGKTYRFDELIEDKKLSASIANRTHSKRAAYRRNGKAVVYKPTRPMTVEEFNEIVHGPTVKSA